MRRLFVYLDKYFTFKTGHYQNMLNNIHNVATNAGYDFLLVHQEYNKYHISENNKFGNIYHIVINYSSKYFKQFFQNECEKMGSYDQIVFYAFKCDTGLIGNMCQIIDTFPDLFAKSKVSLTIFNANELDDKLLENASNHSINIITDLRHIAEEYHQISYCPPPVFQSEKKDIKIWIPLFSNTDNKTNRYEDIVLIDDLTDHLSNYNVDIAIKVAENDLSHTEYNHHLSEYDIVYLPYSPDYYCDRSSMILVEAIIRNQVIISSKDTYISDLCDLTYTYGDFEELIHAFDKAIMGIEFYNHKSDKQIEYAKKWSFEHFFEKVF